MAFGNENLVRKVYCSLMFYYAGWATMPTGAIPTSKNNNPDKKISNNPDDNNPDINADNNNPEIPVNCGYFVGNYFNCWELHNYVFLHLYLQFT